MTLRARTKHVLTLSGAMKAAEAISMFDELAAAFLDATDPSPQMERYRHRFGNIIQVMREVKRQMDAEIRSVCEQHPGAISVETWQIFGQAIRDMNALLDDMRRYA